MIYLGLTGGLRVSELVGLRIDEVRFDGRYVELRVRAMLGTKEVAAPRCSTAVRTPSFASMRAARWTPPSGLNLTRHPSDEIRMSAKFVTFRVGEALYCGLTAALLTKFLPTLWSYT